MQPLRVGLEQPAPCFLPQFPQCRSSRANPDPSCLHGVGRPSSLMFAKWVWLQ